MQVVDGQKGIAVLRTEITGHEAHSSQLHRGASAIMAAGRLIARIDAMTEQRRWAADPNSPFTPAYTTMSVGVIEGGTASNILARRCGFTWDVRTMPGESLGAVLEEFNSEAAAIEAGMRAIAPECSIETQILADAPPLRPEAENPAAELAHALTGANGRQSVSYAAEAGQFQQAGFSTVICGPGSIDQAHQPNEFITLDQVAESTRFMRGLIQHLSA
jgi:acetylornithine deacetylase